MPCIIQSVSLQGSLNLSGARGGASKGRTLAPHTRQYGAPAFQGRGKLAVHAKHADYKAARRMVLRVRDENPDYSFETYFQQVDRVVNVTFPDKDRRKVIGPGKWQVRLLPIQFFFIRFQAVNTITAWARPDGMNLAVTDLVLDGAPPELELNDKLDFKLKGQLRVVRSPASAETGEEAKTVLDGIVAMNLSAEIPDVFATAPGVDQLSQGIMDTILKNLEQSLVKGLTTDYRAWLSEVEDAELTTVA